MGAATRGFKGTGTTGAPLSLAAFTDELLVLDYAAAGTKADACFPVPCGGLPYSSAELRIAFEKGEMSGSLASDYAQGAAIAAKSGMTANVFEDFLAIVAAGRVSETYPTDDFRYVFAGRFESSAGLPTSTVPLVIAKKGADRAVAMVRAYSDDSAIAKSKAQFENYYRFLREP
jgi:hypothetical protein